MEKGWVNPTNSRFYVVRLSLDLFGFWVIEQHWGSLRSNRHGQQKRIFESKEDADRAMQAIDRLRLWHGYIVVS